jgi:FlaA1/EpsC-like NDP-sugar epimerase/UDP-N-acetylmuramyl pentapeptide phosphotransferase/UDP-N-acetylglucosamine-1-phosphate transferase
MSLLVGAVAILSFLVAGQLSLSASWLNLVDYPNGRSLHDRPTPRVGGVAILLSAVAGFVGGGLIGIVPTPEIGGETAWVLWVAGATLLVAAISLTVDLTELPVWIRLMVHSLAAAAIVFGAGLRITEISVPSIGSAPLGATAAPVTILFLMWMANLYNFMDGLDGFAAGMTAFGYGFIAYAAFRSSEPALGVAALLVVAATLGFLPYNWPKSKMFMGDVGSVPLGFLAGALILHGTQRGSFDLWAALLCFAPFVVDASVTLGRRLLRGERVWRAHREHFYQRLVLAGWSHRRTVLAEYAIMVSCGVSAVLYSIAGDRLRFGILLGWTCLFSGFALAVRRVEAKTQRGTSWAPVLLRHRRLLIVAVHAAAVCFANYAAFWMRFDGTVPADAWLLCLQTLPWLIVVRGFTFVPFRLYEGLWRYASIWDLRNIITGVLTSSLVFWGLTEVFLTADRYPLTILVMDAIMLILLMGGLRLGRRISRELRSLESQRRILVYGAGDAGAMIVRDMRNNPFYSYEALGFIDDDPAKTGQRIHGVKVLGTREILPRIMERLQPDAVLVAISRAEPSTIRSIVRALETFKVPIQTLPNLRDIVDGRVAVSQIRTLSVEDLLERVPISLDTTPVRHLIEGRRVLVSGAGGSIGSELSRQIAALRPTALVLLDRYENGLHAVITELRAKMPELFTEAVIADVTDEDRMWEVLVAHQPAIIFHAAAHKHVPLMEANPCEAVKNNVRGTRILAEVARRVGIERLILISTDKAVNPSSVMGATKRVAELLIQSMNGHGPGIFAAVRFGNVLASNGSVVPYFLEQIKGGGPVTVTHPEMRRYFMLIPEAVHLVLQAAPLAKGGDIFVLDLGEQIKILDLARNLIRLSGFVPHAEIPITFTGPRPGERLSEELIGADEIAEPVPAERILRVASTSRPDGEWLDREVAELDRLAAAGDAKAVIEQLCRLVPTYRPVE